jgi:amino acid transporter
MIMTDQERNSNRGRNPQARGSVPASEGTSAGSVPLEERGTLREEVVSRERETFGGIKFGSAFFGWLAATGTAVILTALVAATGAAIGLSADDAQRNLDEQDATTIGIVGAIALIVVLLISYFCGGYVAGRMARFDGLKQGLAVWIWAVVIAVVVAIVGAIAGSQFNVLANLNSFPRIPINEGAVTAGGIITAVILAVASLVGALLGGVAGMRFHRKVDRAGLGR